MAVGCRESVLIRISPRGVSPGWHFFTLRPTFDSRGLNDEQLQTHGVQRRHRANAGWSYTWNPEKEKVKGVPGPLAVLEKAERSWPKPS